MKTMVKINNPENIYILCKVSNSTLYVQNWTNSPNLDHHFEHGWKYLDITEFVGKDGGFETKKEFNDFIQKNKHKLIKLFIKK